MAHIQTIPPEDASGLLAKIYDAAIARAGKVFQILRIQSRAPRTLQASMSLYIATMKSQSKLAPSDREMIAVVVSRANDCHY